MDLKAQMGQFLAPEFTLAQLAEKLFQAETDPDRVVMRQWIYGEEETCRELTRAQVNNRIKVVAARLQQVAEPGTRVAILAGNSPEYVFGFLGALYAGMVPIPLYDPNEPGHSDHLKAVFGDCEPSIVVTNRVSAAAVRTYFSAQRERPRIISLDALPDSLASSWTPVEGTAEDTAFLQYTSGSTRTPAGVELTNRAIITNVAQIFQAVQLQMPARIVSWLPMHHDMGIILAVFVTILGLNLEIMTPRDFVQQPKRWVDQIKRQPIDSQLQGTYAVVPNFALELAARYGAPAAGEELDLSNVEGIIIGSEPVTESAVNAFWETFGKEEYGLRRETLRPSYGMAEASLIVTTPQTPERPIISHFDRERLAHGEAVIVEKSEDSVAYASCGQSVVAQDLTIVDPETRAELADGHVGEIWLHGENRAAGYLGRDEETASTFHNTLGKRLAEGSRVANAPDDNNWLATGDLATIVDNQVYITGRLKDLIVVAGRNHYPQDIEGTVQEASAHVRADSIAAFSVEGGSTEELVLLIERADGANPAEDESASEAIRSAVSSHHGVTPAAIQWFNANEIKRTSSGKIARRVAKKEYLAS